MRHELAVSLSRWHRLLLEVKTQKEETVVRQISEKVYHKPRWQKENSRTDFVPVEDIPVSLTGWIGRGKIYIKMTESPNYK